MTLATPASCRISTDDDICILHLLLHFAYALFSALLLRPRFGPFKYNMMVVKGNAYREGSFLDFTYWDTNSNREIVLLVAVDFKRIII